MAIASMVLGILSVTCLYILAGLPAIILGHAAYNRSRREPERYGGGGFAIAGFVMGYVSIALTILVAAIAVPNFMKARETAMKSACIFNLKQIEAAKEQWGLENKKVAGDAVEVAAVNAFLRNSQAPVCPAGGTYSYNVICKVPTCSHGADLGHTL